MNDSYAAQAEAQQDISSCTTTQTQAQRCCNNPASCLSGSDRARYTALMNGSNEELSMSEMCEQLQSASSTSGDLNGRVGALCTNNQYACTNTCGSYVTKYRNLIASCENCESYSIYQDTLATLQAKQNSCRQLEARGDTLVRQSLASAQPQGLAEYCAQQTASDSSLSSLASALDTSATPTSATDPAFTQTPPAAAPAVPTAAAPEGQFQTAPTGAQATGGFDLGTATSGRDELSFEGDGKYGTPPTVPVAGGGGGGGGLFGGTGTSASLGNDQRRGTSPGSPGYDTDINEGFRSGGYSAPVTDPSLPADEVERRRLMGGANAGTATDDSGLLGVDLKEYLPGGSRYQARGLASVNYHSEIGRKEDDMWRRITNKMIEKCKLGILWRCQD